MTKYPFMPFYVADFQADTMHLNWKEKAAYRALLDAYWLRSKGPKNDDVQLARIIGMTPEEWKEVRDQVLEFFTEEEGFLVQKRMEKEIQIARGITETAREKANKRWKKGENSEKACHSNADAMPQHSYSNADAMPSTSTSTSIGLKPSSVPGSEFEEFAQSEKSDRENLDPSETTEEAPSSTPPDDFDPIASLVMPKGVKLSQKELRELYQAVGENAQKHLDRYALAKQAKDLGYRNDWAGLRYFWDRAGGSQAWLAGAPQGQQGADLSARQELASKPLKPREATTLDQGVEQGKRALAGMSARDFTRRSTA